MIKKYAYIVGYEGSSGKWATAYFTEIEQARKLYSTFIEKKIKATISIEPYELEVKKVKRQMALTMPTQHFIDKPVDVYAQFLSDCYIAGEKHIVKITERLTWNDHNIYIATLDNGKRHYIYLDESNGFFVDDIHELK